MHDRAESPAEPHRTDAGPIESLRPGPPPGGGDGTSAAVGRHRTAASVIESSPHGAPPPRGEDGAAAPARPHRRAAKRADPLRRRKAALFAAALLPLAWIVATATTATDPIEAIQLGTGRWGLVFLALTLAVTPARRLLRWNEAVRYRRMLGLFSFFYASVHLLNYMVFDWSLDLAEIAGDVAEHRYIALGMTAFALMVPLAVTSTQGWIRRLGKRWQQLHRLVYLAAAAGLIHFLWAVKWDKSLPFAYITAFALVLGARAWVAWRGRRAR
jgi:sulfoxide reductase heme-binding subunit YedZ